MGKGHRDRQLLINPKPPQADIFLNIKQTHHPLRPPAAPAVAAGLATTFRGEALFPLLLSFPNATALPILPPPSLNLSHR